MQRRAISIVGVGALMFTTALAAQEFGLDDFELFRSSINSGGGSISAGNLQVNSTIGQVEATPPEMTGGDFVLAGGFWVADINPADPCLPDITGDLVVNVTDLLAVINNWGSCQGCAGDVAPQPQGDGLVNVSDLLIIINGWGSCPG